MTDKKTNADYAWHGNVVAGLVSQPKIIEYFLTIDNVTYQVEKSDYDCITVGDQMKASLTKKRGKILKMENKKNIN